MFSVHKRVSKFSGSVVVREFVFRQFVYVPVVVSSEIYGAETWVTERPCGINVSFAFVAVLVYFYGCYCVSSVSIEFV